MVRQQKKSVLLTLIFFVSDGKSAQTNGIESVGVLSGLIGGRMDSRAQSATSGVQGQAQAQQGSAGGQRNRMVEVDNGQERHDEPPEDYYIADLYQQLSSVIVAKPTEVEPLRIGIYQMFFNLIDHFFIFFS